MSGSECTFNTSRDKSNMKRSIEVGCDSRHCRDGSVSSIGSWSCGCYYDDESSCGSSFPGQQQPQQSNVRRRLYGPEVTILASSSPEIHALCKTFQDSPFKYSSAAFRNSPASESPFDDPRAHYALSALEIPECSPAYTRPGFVRSITETNEDRFAANEFNDVTMSLSTIDIQSDHRETISPRYHGNPILAKPRKSLHRRASCDMLPSPLEIASYPPYPPVAYGNNRPSHRRNMNQIVVETRPPEPF